MPPASGPDKIDANTVAEYLDSDLSPEMIAEVEEMALGLGCSISPKSRRAAKF